MSFIDSKGPSYMEAGFPKSKPNIRAVNPLFNAMVKDIALNTALFDCVLRLIRVPC